MKYLCFIWAVVSLHFSSYQINCREAKLAHFLSVLISNLDNLKSKSSLSYHQRLNWSSYKYIFVACLLKRHSVRFTLLSIVETIQMPLHFGANNASRWAPTLPCCLRKFQLWINNHIFRLKLDWMRMPYSIKIFEIPSSGPLKICAERMRRMDLTFTVRELGFVKRVSEVY